MDATQIELTAPVIQAIKSIVKAEVQTALQNRTSSPQPTKPHFKPVFPGLRLNTGVRISRRLLRDAREKAKREDPVLTNNGQLTPLVEFLLWQYLDFNPKYTQPEPEDE